MSGAAAEWDGGQAAPADIPTVVLDGYAGPLDHLLAMARAHKVDLSRLSQRDVAEQLGIAMQQASPSVPLGQRAGWLVMGAWLLLLRSRLLLPEGEPARAAADAEAGGLRTRLRELHQVQALAAWLDGRPQLGRDVFARGAPEWAGPLGPEHQVDVIEFLWAAMALFDADLPAAETMPVYRPEWLDLHSVPIARERIRRLMAEETAPVALARLLPPSAPDEAAPGVLKRRSAWSSTFVASLELARLGEVALEQDGAFARIHVRVGGGVGQAEQGA